MNRDKVNDAVGKTAWLLLSDPDHEELQRIGKPIEKSLGITGLVILDKESVERWISCSFGDHYVRKVKIFERVEDVTEEGRKQLI